MIFTNEEARAMRGTPFTYVFSDGDELLAFVAEVDLSKGLTCKALKRYSRDGFEVWSERKAVLDPKNYDNVVCIAVDGKDLEREEQIKKIHLRLTTIKEKGRWTQIENTNPFAVMRTCAF